MAATVQGSELTKVYQLGNELVYALNRASLEVYPGELLAVVGRAGSGKSTLLHVLGCLQRPDAGSVRVEGQDVTELAEEELAEVRTRKVGFVFQAYNLLPNETMLGNVLVSLRHGDPDSYDRREKAVIFADEPTRALDSTSREEVMGLLQRLNSEGRTIVVSTDDSGVAGYCQRMVRIYGGRTTEAEAVGKRRVISPSRVPGRASSFSTREVTVCPRCNYGNFKDDELCQRCESPLHLTKEEEESIEGRLSGRGSRYLGAESASDEGEVPGQGQTDELKEVPMLAGLGTKSLARIVAALEPRSFQPGSTIVKQGEPGGSFYIVRSGSVQVMLEREGTPAITVAELGPREGFGEMALLTDQPRSASVVAVTDVET